MVRFASESYFTLLDKDLAAVVMKIQATDMIHPRYINLFPNYALLPKQIKSLEISDPGALVSMLEKGKDLFVVIVNHDINHNITVKIKGTYGLRMISKAGDVVDVIEEQKQLFF